MSFMLDNNYKSMNETRIIEQLRKRPTKTDIFCDFKMTRERKGYTRLEKDIRFKFNIFSHKVEVARGLKKKTVIKTVAITLTYKDADGTLFTKRFKSFKGISLFLDAMAEIQQSVVDYYERVKFADLDRMNAIYGSENRKLNDRVKVLEKGYSILRIENENLKHDAEQKDKAISYLSSN